MYAFILPLQDSLTEDLRGSNIDFALTDVFLLDVKKMDLLIFSIT